MASVTSLLSKKGGAGCSKSTVRNERMDTGHEIHKVLENTICDTVGVNFCYQDAVIVKLIKMINYHQQIVFLMNEGHVRELPVSIMNHGYRIDGVIDRVSIDGNNLIIEELKTYTSNSKPWFYTEKAMNQANLYALAIDDLRQTKDIYSYILGVFNLRHDLDKLDGQVLPQIIACEPNYVGKTYKQLLNEIAEAWLSIKKRTKFIETRLCYISQDEYKKSNGQPSKINMHCTSARRYIREKTIDLLTKMQGEKMKEKERMPTNQCQRARVAKRMGRRKIEKQFKELEIIEHEIEEKEDQGPSHFDLSKMWRFDVKPSPIKIPEKLYQEHPNRVMDGLMLFDQQCEIYTHQIQGLCVTDPAGLFVQENDDSETETVVHTTKRKLVELISGVREIIDLLDEMKAEFIDQVLTIHTTPYNSLTTCRIVVVYAYSKARCAAVRLCAALVWLNGLLQPRNDEDWDKNIVLNTFTKLMWYAKTCIPDHNLYNGKGTGLKTPTHLMDAIYKFSLLDVIDELTPDADEEDNEEEEEEEYGWTYTPLYKPLDKYLCYMHEIASFPIIPPDMVVQMETVMNRDDDLKEGLPLHVPGKNNRLYQKNIYDNTPCVHCMINSMKIGCLDHTTIYRNERCMHINYVNDGTGQVLYLDAVTMTKACSLERVLLHTKMGRDALRTSTQGSECKEHRFIFNKNYKDFAAYMRGALSK